MRADVFRSYDEIQIEAVLVTRLCCKRTVWATHPEGRCAVCRAWSARPAGQRTWGSTASKAGGA